ncbi:MAG: hypothetical protein M3O70_11180, partial [Actinomycetota bacterium]|nr:hypothetical protein [Actinomycetota bacterium]
QARAMLLEVAEEGDRATTAVRDLAERVEKLRLEWTAAHRYTPEALDKLEQELAVALEADAIAGGQRWLSEVLDAADDGEEDAAAHIANADLPWPVELRAGVELLGQGFANWREGGRTPELEPLEEFADGRLEGWDQVLSAELRSRTHRFAAWVALQSGGKEDAARRHMDQAISLYPFAGRMHAERAAFHLFVGDFDRAATDAQHAIEMAPREAYGYLTLGIWAELTGKFSGADDLYRRALDLMSPMAIARIPQRTALVAPTGRLLKTAAAALLEAGRPEQALSLAHEALLSGIRGPEAYPEAEAHIIRRRALEQLPEPLVAEAAAAAMQAGRMCIWNGDVDCAIEELTRATELDTTVEAGWLLADAMLSKSFPLGNSVPDQDLVARARSAWQGWAEKVGLPRGDTTWAYLTRGIIADLQSQRPGADRRAGIFEALMFVEKSLVHDDTDAQRWGYAAQFLRYAGLEQLAFEAVERGYALAALDRQVLAERLPLLANRREFDEAQAVAERIVKTYGQDPWVSAVRAWLAIHDRHDYRQALQLLELPLAEGNDLAWYREMEALAHLGTGNIDGAREAYRRLLEAPPLDGNTKCRLALASLALGDPVGMEQFLSDARDDPTTPQSVYAMVRAIQALAGDELEEAILRLASAIRLCKSTVEIDDVLFETMLTLRALGRAEAWAAERERELRKALNSTVEQQTASLAENPPTADAELQEAVGELPEKGSLGIEQTTLLAVTARRHAFHGRVDEAAQAYQRLRGSRLDPEASIALERALRGAQT